MACIAEIVSTKVSKHRHIFTILRKPRGCYRSPSARIQQPRRRLRPGHRAVEPPSKESWDLRDNSCSSGQDIQPPTRSSTPPAWILAFWTLKTQTCLCGEHLEDSDGSIEQQWAHIPVSVVSSYVQIGSAHLADLHRWRQQTPPPPAPEQEEESFNSNDIPGLNTRQLSVLPRRGINKAGFGSEGYAERTTCLSRVVIGERVTTLPPCYHRFHHDCIGDWLRINKTCPYWRKDVKTALSTARSERSELGPWRLFRGGEKDDGWGV
ncbi:hypothetical protein BU16DRAFT_51816 [Lophium mytilinum]|uniref:RING-type domain-containing protein n=1 Tax=Lophium mytilinum TaxID=390894 RepID=A0A6A6QS75_9PEZI|nr:hypothetical protein BU16DRAFT_51816 [Lophium mytilinum]